MDEQLNFLNKMFPHGEYVQIKKYDASLWETQEYNSHFENKSPMNQWRTNPLSFEQISNCCDEGWRVGWVVPEGYVVVDIDNEDHPKSAERVLTVLKEKGIKFNYNITSRGIHFLFKDSKKSVKNGAVQKCSIGVTVDHRANHNGYIILPCNDPHRFWGTWTEELDEIPFFLKPIMSAKDQIMSFIDMGEGDGRNDEMFKWRRRLLGTNKLTTPEITDSLRIINTYLFKDPMPEQEMISSVTRERPTDDEIRKSAESFEEVGLSKKGKNPLEKDNVYNLIARKIVEENDIMCIGYKQFYKFDKTHYEPMKEIDVERMIHYDISENINATGRKEIMQFMAVKTLIDPGELNKAWNKIAVGNGVLDLVTGELSEPDRNEKNTISIPWNYNPDPEYSPKIDEFMTQLSSNSDGTANLMKKQFLYQIAGYCLLKKNVLGKFFIFQGEGQTGKSTFQDLIVKMIGENNRSRVGIDKMDNDYYLATIMGKLVNVDDDAVDGKSLENTGRLKSLVTGNEITVRQIFQEPVTFTSFATCMFSCNKLPRIMDKTTGLYRRMVIIELNHKVQNPDLLFLSKLTKRDMEYFLFQSVYWVGVALQEGAFRISQSEQELLRKFKCRQSSLNEWLYEENYTLGDIYYKRISVLYSFYQEWATSNGYTKIPSMVTFREDICTLFNVSYGFDKTDPSSGHRSSDQVFVRREYPSPKEMEMKPF